MFEIKGDQNETDKSKIYKKGDLILRYESHQIEFLTKLMIALKKTKNENEFMKIVGQEMSSLNNGTKLA